MSLLPKTKVLTLCFTFKDSSWQQVLLGMKKRGFGAGRYNGFGGKVEPGETIKQGAIRELEEESGVIADEENVRQVGRIHFEFVGDPVWMDVHVYALEKYSGDVTETDEMKPAWFDANLKTLPFSEMWPDDKFWFPFLLSKTPFFAYFQFLGHDKVLRYTIKQVKDSNFNDQSIPWYNDDEKQNELTVLQ